MRYLNAELVLQQVNDDEQMLSRLSPMVRRWIQRTADVGYEIRIRVTLELLKEVW